MENSPKKLPKLEELHYDVVKAFENDSLNLLLNAHCPDIWVKQNKYAGNTNYLPIARVEDLLTRIFQEWKIEVLAEGQLFNSVYVKIRLHYKNPLNGEWKFHDGLGAVGIQTDAGAKASDLNAIKQTAVMMALPAAKSYAIKDAAEHLGTLFGRDLNRKDVIAFQPAYLKEQWKQE
jgi:hypothetical protein